MTRARRVLCLNAGSSSLKFALFEIDERERRLASGIVDRLGSSDTLLRVRDERGGLVAERAVAGRDPAAPAHAVLDALVQAGLPPPDAVGHRIVHGGPDHVAPERVDARLLADLRRLVPFAPLHLPGEITGIEAVAARAPDLPQVACFDTAFHRTMPELAQRLPLPGALWRDGIRRYGFHGLSYEYVVGALGERARGRVVVAHLGNGASMVALRDGVSVDTTMGFSPIGGLVMGTRSGDLDPGVLLHLLLARGYDAAALARLVDDESGLLGISGRTADMQTLLALRARDADAARAVAMFCRSARLHVGALAAELGGLDGLVFTGGIGEHAAAVRAEICVGLEHLGVRLDPARNAGNAEVISAADGSCTVRVIATDEDLVIARHTRALVGG